MSMITDVCTVEYPQIEGIDYDLAVDIINLCMILR